jgi:hypothetical protein
LAGRIKSFAPSGIEPTSYRLVTQCLYQVLHGGPQILEENNLKIINYICKQLTRSVLFCTRFTILNSVLVTDPKDLMQLVNSESRVMLLYSTREEAIHILNEAKNYKITGENYVWVVTQSVIENLQTPFAFPVGMLGK